MRIPLCLIAVFCVTFEFWGCGASDDARVSVDASHTVRVVDARLFGVNAPIWDWFLDTTNTVRALREMGVGVLRFGCFADQYHWESNSATFGTNHETFRVSFLSFAHVVTNIHAQAIITVNYGSGTAAEAAAWVRYANITNHFGIEYWEIGNENFGWWEYDENSPPHDPVTYARKAGEYFTRMKSADPSIKIGVVITEGYSNWTPKMLATLKQLGVRPDFVSYHLYAENPGVEDDARLLQAGVRWKKAATLFRRQLNKYFGATGTNVELLCTENNSVSERTGKQTTSLVNGLYLADSFGQIAQTEFNSFLWWDLRNVRDWKTNNSRSLYGWRQYGDHGIMWGKEGRYPTFYAFKLLKFFARGGDKIVRVTSDNKLLSVYAASRADGSVAMLVINKNPESAMNVDFSIAGFQPRSAGTIYFYGIPQDEAARTGIGSPDIEQTTFNGAASKFHRQFPPYSATVMVLSPAA